MAKWNLAKVLLKFPLLQINAHFLLDCSTRLPAIEFVCVEVLRPSQPNGVMSSAVSLPNHTFSGQA